MKKFTLYKLALWHLLIAVAITCTAIQSKCQLIDLPCPGGTGPLSALVTRNPLDSGLKYWGCVAALDGTLTIQTGATTNPALGTVSLNTYITGGNGTWASPWTSASGTGGVNEARAALLAASPFGGIINAACGVYGLTTPGNLSNNSTSFQGTVSDGSFGPTIQLVGSGLYCTVFQANTGGVAFDTTGSNFTSIRELSIIGQGTLATPSTVGILMARASVSQFSANGRYIHLFIDLPHIATANSNNGTVAIYNYQSEVNTYYNNDFRADNPIVLTGSNVYGITSPYQTVTNVDGTTQNKFLNTYTQTYGGSSNQNVFLEGDGIDNERFDGIAYASSSDIVPFRIYNSTLSRNLYIDAEPSSTTDTKFIVLSGLLYGCNLVGNYRNGTGIGAIHLTKVGSYIAGRIDNAAINISPATNSLVNPLIDDDGVANGYAVNNPTIYLWHNQTINAPNTVVTVPSISGADSPLTITWQTGGASQNGITLSGSGVNFSGNTTVNGTLVDNSASANTGFSLFNNSSVLQSYTRWNGGNGGVFGIADTTGTTQIQLVGVGGQNFFNSGNLSIGNNSPTAALGVGTTNQFQVSSAGAVSTTSTITPSQTNGIVGTTTNNNANAGSFGEYVTSTLATGSSVSLSTGTTANITSISLTAGDWDVSGTVDYTAGATTSITNQRQGISTTSATLGTQDTFSSDSTAAQVPTAAFDDAFPTPTVRLSLASTTTVFLVANATFTVSTLKGYGTIRARRVR